MLGGVARAYIPDGSRCADRVAVARSAAVAASGPAPRTAAAQEDAAVTRPSRTASPSAW